MPAWDLIAVEPRGRVDGQTWQDAVAQAGRALGADIAEDAVVIHDSGELELRLGPGARARLVPRSGEPPAAAGEGTSGRPAAPDEPCAVEALPTFEIEPVAASPLGPLAEAPTLPLATVSVLHDVDSDAPTQLFGAVEPIAPTVAAGPTVCVVEWDGEATA